MRKLYSLEFKALNDHSQSRRGPCLGSDSHFINLDRQQIHRNLSALKRYVNAVNAFFWFRHIYLLLLCLDSRSGPLLNLRSHIVVQTLMEFDLRLFFSLLIWVWRRRIGFFKSCNHHAFHELALCLNL